MAWWLVRPEALADIRAALVGPYAGLQLIEDGQNVEVRGIFPVLDDGEVLDQYEVLIRFPELYPDDPPEVWETGGRIPRLADRHNSETACLFVPFEWRIRRPDLSFSTFLNDAMRGYFIGQSLAELGKPWPHGERDHGIAGMLQALADLLGVTEIDVAQRAMRMLIKTEIKGHWHCFCGSGFRLRHCHGEQLRTLHRAGTAQSALRTLQRIPQRSETAKFQA